MHFVLLISATLKILKFLILNKRSYFFWFILLLASCGLKQSFNKPGVDGVSVPCVMVSSSDEVIAVKNDSLLTVIKDALTPVCIDGLFAGNNAMNKLRPNQYVNNQYDTIRTYVRGCDSAVYIASKENAFPLYMTLQTEKNDWSVATLKMGISRAAFLKLLAAENIKQYIIKITETEGANELLFVFRQGVLARFDYTNLYVE